MNRRVKLAVSASILSTMVMLALFYGYVKPAPMIFPGSGVSVGMIYATAVNVKQCCGAVGNGVADDTAAITAAANLGQGAVFIPAGTYNISSALPMLTSLHYYGVGNATILNGTSAGMNMFQGPATGQLTHAGIHDLKIQGSLTNGIYMPAPAGGNPSTYISLTDLDIAGFSGAGIYQQNQSEEWYVYNVKIQGGQYGIRWNHPTVGTVDKSTFINLELNGSSINGWRMEVFLATSVTVINPIVIFNGQHGMYFDCGCAGMQIINMNTEANGAGQTSVITTGSINSASPTLTVASATGMSIGNTATVEGAGVNGFDHVSLIDNIVGTTVTLHDNASTTVTSKEVTTALWSDIFFNNTVNAAYDTQLIGGSIGYWNGAGGSIRYAINGEKASVMTVIGTSIGRPIYDPNSNIGVMGSNSSLIRQANFGTTDGFRASATGPKKGPRTMITSPFGTDIWMALRDSNDDATGTFGEFQVKRKDGNRTAIFRVLGSNGNAFLYGGFETFEFLKMGKYFEGPEIADPAAPATNNGRLYFKDNGAGKTQACVKFPTGIPQCFATEP